MDATYGLSLLSVLCALNKTRANIAAQIFALERLGRASRENLREHFEWNQKSYQPGRSTKQATNNFFSFYVFPSRKKQQSSERGHLQQR